MSGATSTQGGASAAQSSTARSVEGKKVKTARRK
jgi:hypothetical protein